MLGVARARPCQQASATAPSTSQHCPLLAHPPTAVSRLHRLLQRPLVLACWRRGGRGCRTGGGGLTCACVLASRRARKRARPQHMGTQRKAHRSARAAGAGGRQQEQVAGGGAEALTQVEQQRHLLRRHTLAVQQQRCQAAPPLGRRVRRHRCVAHARLPAQLGLGGGGAWGPERRGQGGAAGQPAATALLPKGPALQPRTCH